MFRSSPSNPASRPADSRERKQTSTRAGKVAWSTADASPRDRSPFCTESDNSILREGGAMEARDGSADRLERSHAGGIRCCCSLVQTNKNIWTYLQYKSLHFCLTFPRLTIRILIEDKQFSKWNETLKTLQRLY